MTDPLLRPTVLADAGTFFVHAQDPEANRAAAFTAKDPADRAAHDAHWTRILGDPSVVSRTLVVDGAIAGYVASFLRGEDREVCYWLGREFWGRGLATRALAALLAELEARPLFARVAKDNLASVRVLEKCGFFVCGEDRGFSSSRGCEVEEWVLRLAAT